jgi:hypothetical protein
MTIAELVLVDGIPALAPAQTHRMRISYSHGRKETCSMIFAVRRVYATLDRVQVFRVCHRLKILRRKSQLHSDGALRFSSNALHY